MRARLTLIGLILAPTVLVFIHNASNSRQNTSEHEYIQHNDTPGIEAFAVRLSPVAAVQKFECNRCHELGIIAALALPVPEKDCVGCHEKILNGGFDNDTRAVSWRERITHFTSAPPLMNLSLRLKRNWFEQFLRMPHIVRPRLGTIMPALEYSHGELKLIADFFFGLETSAEITELQAKGDVLSGRSLLDTKGCGTCHVMGGVAALQQGTLEVPLSEREIRQAMPLAPDLRYTRERMSLAQLTRWLKQPESVIPSEFRNMPHIRLLDKEISDISSYIFHAALDPIISVPLPNLPAPISRSVSYAEVRERVFRKTCFHCHSDPEPVGGDGGPVSERHLVYF